MPARTTSASATAARTRGFMSVKTPSRVSRFLADVSLRSHRHRRSLEQVNLLRALLADVAQLVEQRFRKPPVGSSSLPIGSVEFRRKVSYRAARQGRAASHKPKV